MTHYTKQVVVIIFIWMSSTSTIQAQTTSGKASQGQLPTDPLSQKAKDAYNAGRYNEAARILKRLAVRWPSHGAVYQALARAYSWASEPGKAIIAYRHAMALDLEKAEQNKIKAELELLMRRVKKPPSKSLSPQVLKAHEAIETRAKSGRFNGQDGAYGALELLVEKHEVSPRLAQTKKVIRDALRAQSEDAIGRWFRPEAHVEPDTLMELSAAWDNAQKYHERSQAELGLMKKIDGLAHLAHGDWKKAARLLEASAPGDVRMRYAQTIGLIRSERYVEAHDLLKAIKRGNSDPRIALLYGFVLQKLGKKGFVDAYRNALENEDSP
ncbi:MAG: hypothetical protein VX589_14900 [Myxococcota bacterium]|nr:hypothetical protein [Myxococcota bacterium]